IFFVKQLFKDYEVHHRLVQLIFSINFSLSCTMFELIIFEILNILDSSSRYFHWNIVLYCMLFMVIVLIPFYIGYFIVTNIRFVSFLLVGCIVLTSIRGLLLTLTKFFYAISSSKSSNIIVLVLAQIMGMYFVSSVLLMRMNMPPEYRSIISKVLGDLQFNFYHRWFDVIFLLSALSSIVFLYLAHIQSSNNISAEQLISKGIRS
ncbi:Golgi pH regulator-like, partial [Diaphorina citri]|uniref:Golgi pH regulator-like n=1 Tax=Diaphorina citri TaxID=121845 RepID=A0A1S3DCD6_DIACI